MIRVMILAITSSLILAGAAAAQDSSDTAARAGSAVVGSEISREVSTMTADQVGTAVQEGTEEMREDMPKSADAPMGDQSAAKRSK